MRGVDLNHRPLGYEPNELPDCSTPQIDDSNRLVCRQTSIRCAARQSPEGSWPKEKRLIQFDHVSILTLAGPVELFLQSQRILFECSASKSVLPTTPT